MGGHALSCPTKRLDAEMYHRLAQTIAQEARETFGVRCVPVEAYREKASFGDLDLLVAREGDLDGPLDILGEGGAQRPVAETIGRLERFAREHHSREVFRLKNSPVFSFEHRDKASDKEGFQVDMILTEPRYFDSARDYFAFNDLGNLAGRLARRLGCKYGPTGLHCRVFDGRELLGSIELTHDTRRIHETLDLDHASYLQGFERLEDIFHFVTASRLFHPGLYDLARSNHRARTRDLKRPSYQQFLAHIADHPLAKTPLDEDASVWLDFLDEQFPGLKTHVSDMRKAHATKKRVKQWFNGQRVAEWTGLSGRDLGALMAQIRIEAGDSWWRELEKAGEDVTRERAMALVSENTDGTALRRHRDDRPR